MYTAYCEQGQLTELYRNNRTDVYRNSSTRYLWKIIQRTHKQPAELSRQKNKNKSYLDFYNSFLQM
jgi:hypothetical protein